MPGRSYDKIARRVARSKKLHEAVETMVKRVLERELRSHRVTQPVAQQVVRTVVARTRQEQTHKDEAESPHQEETHKEQLYQPTETDKQDAENFERAVRKREALARTQRERQVTQSVTHKVVRVAPPNEAVAKTVVEPSLLMVGYSPMLASVCDDGTLLVLTTHQDVTSLSHHNGSELLSRRTLETLPTVVVREDDFVYVITTSLVMTTVVRYGLPLDDKDEGEVATHAGALTITRDGRWCLAGDVVYRTKLSELVLKHSKMQWSACRHLVSSSHSVYLLSYTRLHRYSTSLAIKSLVVWSHVMNSSKYTHVSCSDELVSYSDGDSLTIVDNNEKSSTVKSRCKSLAVCGGVVCCLLAGGLLELRDRDGSLINKLTLENTGDYTQLVAHGDDLYYNSSYGLHVVRELSRA